MARVPVGILATFKSAEPVVGLEQYDGQTIFVREKSSASDFLGGTYCIEFEDGAITYVMGDNILPYMGKQLHWYEDYSDMPTFVGPFAHFAVGNYMMRRIEKQMDTHTSILTDQADMMKAQYLDEGYRMFVHFHSGEIVEIKYGMTMPNGVELRDPKPLRYDFPYMIKNGDFGALSD